MLKGYEEPRIFTPPLRPLTPDTSLGFDVIFFAETILNVALLPWQKWLFIHALEIVGDFEGEWHFRFRTILVLISRQNGKTFVGKILAAYFLYVLGVALVIGTAQSLDQAEDTWNETVDMVSDIPSLAEEIEHVWHTNGAKRLALTGGRDYRVKASSRRAGRGKSGDLVMLDELREHQDFQAWGAITKTTMARPDALVWCMSNAGDGTSVVLRHLRKVAHAALGDPDGIVEAFGGAEVEPGEDMLDDTLAIFEWSAPPDAELNDREAWAQSNPSLGYGMLTERALKSAYSTDPADVFKTECLCQWVTASVTPPFPADAWEAGKDEKSSFAPDAEIFYGVDVSADRLKTAICACGLRSDRSWHGELAAYRSGTAWIEGWFRNGAAVQPMKVALQGRGAPVSAFAEILNAIDGVTVIECSGRDVAAWSGRMWDAVASCDEDSESDATPIHHRSQPALDLAAQIAATRPMGDGAWAWDRNKSLEDISPLVALTMAHGAATHIEDAPQKSAYDNTEGVVFL